MTGIDAWGTFLHSAFFSGLVILLVGLLFVGWLMAAEAHAERLHWERQATRKMKAVRK